jgi:hypothetical protein
MAFKSEVSNASSRQPFGAGIAFQKCLEVFPALWRIPEIPSLTFYRIADNVWCSH